MLGSALTLEEALGSGLGLLGAFLDTWVRMRTRSILSLAWRCLAQRSSQDKPCLAALLGSAFTLGEALDSQAYEAWLEPCCSSVL